MSSRKLFVIVGLVIGVVIFAGSGFLAGYTVARHNPDTLVIEGVRDIATPGDVQADFGLFWRAWRLMEEKHLYAASTTPQDRVYGAIQGLIGSLGDPYSEFFTPTSSQQFQEDIQGSFGGVGLEIGKREGQLVVIAPLKGMPGDQAGLRAWDAILEIDGEITNNMTVTDAVSRIRGPMGSEVTLTIFREGEDDAREVTLRRTRIQIPTLDFSMRGDIAYVQLYEFTGVATDLFRTNVANQLPQNTKGMVLDLRDNPGGYLEVAVDIAGWFVDPGTVVVREEGGEDYNYEFEATGNGTLKDLPVVVLINEGSASASEILAGALRDINGTDLVGKTSFGKGTVQEVIDLPGKASVKLTVAHWILPRGQVLEGTGLKPDIEVELPATWKTGDPDPQLNRALELLR